MPIYHVRRWGAGRGAHFTNWHQTAESLGSITRLTQELNEIAWVLAHRVENGESNVSSQGIPQRLAGIVTVLEGLRTQVEEVLAGEKLPDASVAEEALESVKLSEAKELLRSVAPPVPTMPVDEQKSIRGKRFQARTRDGRVFLAYRKRSDLPIWIGFELDFSAAANSSSRPVYLNSQAAAEAFVNGN